ncbi:hypothetical protein [Lysinibacillus fusiformis]|uniref:Uncharacterized protein n=1 Tax=Lysinibacillus fusiformis TaxID=28031 RepID=A0A1H9IAT1_9BACI|nr:hypothetical protein [Lysinibacillus fusiformis]SCY38520.1 hypothetical protein SAMN02787081_02318 [Lysinibacillus fusiformis]SEN62460.1 hypothetical protein SAMN02787103_02212 [Lysinibacillus fusiformis]SEQ71669.1 hypothetical protein SAMN02787113_02218 [Lysinibacillus fusiformis]
MFEERQQQHTKWFIDGNLKLRQQDLGDGRIGIWVSILNLNASFTMIIYDFIDWCLEMDINLEVDTSWNKHRGFVIESKDLVLLSSEIKRFIDIYNLTPSEDEDKFSDDEWYS